MNETVKYNAVIVDLDGTLYFQTPVRIRMALSILAFCIIHPLEWKEIFLARDYRKLYAGGISHLERCSKLARHYNIPVYQVERTVHDWMVKRPLPFVHKFRNKKLLSLLKDIRKDNTKVIVYSDYPVINKLQALGLTPDAAYSAEDVGCLKPSPDGLLRILKENGLAVSDCLFIGDRYEKDGKCAENAGMDYYILPQGKFKKGKSHAMPGMRFQ
jgi:HAD superfamily hydrolase (TIGR01549 family)